MEEEKVETELAEPSAKKISVEELEKLINEKNVSGLREVFQTVQDIDIAQAADELEITQLIYIFRAIPPSYTATFFEFLSQKSKTELVKALTDKELIKLINEQYADDIADFVDEMPANLAVKVLSAANKDMREDINELLHYEKGTAGAIMTTEYLEFNKKSTVEDTIEAIRNKGKDAETIYTIFVRDDKRDFVGTVDLDDLIFAKKEQTLEEIMNKDTVSVATSTDQEAVAKVFRRYDLSALAVLNEDHKLTGIITIDDAVDVLTEESQEDMAKVTAMAPSNKRYMETSSWENAKSCIPWLMILLVMGTFTTLILNRLESQKIFSTVATLTAFIPVLMDTGGNAGGQTTGLMIRALAVDDIAPKDTLKVLFKEMKTAIIVALAVGCFAFLWTNIEAYTGIVDLGDLSETGDPSNPLYLIGATIWNGKCWTEEFVLHALQFGGLVGLTIMAAILGAKIIGALLPLGAAAIKKDPALFSQPLLTTIMDTVTLLVYFGVACAFFPVYA